MNKAFTQREFSFASEEAQRLLIGANTLFLPIASCIKDAERVIGVKVLEGGTHGYYQ